MICQKGYCHGHKPNLKLAPVDPRDHSSYAMFGKPPTSVAQNMKTLIICLFAAITVVSAAVVVTQQIAEAAGAGVTISEAIKD